MIRSEHPTSERRGRPALLLSASMAVLVLAAVACSSNSSPTTTTNQTTPAAVATSPPAGSSSPLTGRWNGTFSGTFTGTFKLTWRETSSNLHGVIHLDPGGSSTINGTVSGNSIRFGTVGSSAVTYTGIVSGDRMSGTWKIHATGGGSGTWSATRA